MSEFLATFEVLEDVDEPLTGAELEEAVLTGVSPNETRTPIAPWARGYPYDLLVERPGVDVVDLETEVCRETKRPASAFATSSGNSSPTSRSATCWPGRRLPRTTWNSERPRRKAGVIDGVIQPPGTFHRPDGPVRSLPLCHYGQNYFRSRVERRPMAEDDTSRGWVRRDPDDIPEAMEPGEPYTSAELADVLGWPRRSVHHVLGELEEDGEVTSKKAGPARVWMLGESE